MAMDLAGEAWERIEVVAEMADCRLKARLVEVVKESGK